MLLRLSKIAMIAGLAAFALIVAYYNVAITIRTMNSCATS